MKKNRKARAPRAKKPGTVKGLALYANHVDAQWGTCEIQLRLSQTAITGTDPPSVEVTEVAKVALPVQAAKVAAFHLLCNIAVHESLFGPVNILPKLAPSMPSAKLLGPETVARLAILYVELFAPIPTPAPAASPPAPETAADVDGEDLFNTPTNGVIVAVKGEAIAIRDDGWEKVKTPRKRDAKPTMH